MCNTRTYICKAEELIYWLGNFPKDSNIEMGSYGGASIDVTKNGQLLGGFYDDSDANRTILNSTIFKEYEE